MKTSRHHWLRLVLMVILSMSQVGIGFCWQEGVGAPVTVVQFFLPGGRLPSREIKFELRREIGSVETMTTDQRGRVQITSMASKSFNLSGRRGERCRVAVNADKTSFGATLAVLNLGSGQGYAPIFLSPPAREDSDQPENSNKGPEIEDLDKKAPAEAAASFENASNGVRSGNQELAISEFTKALMLYPAYPRALNQLGLLYFNHNRFEEAVAAFTQAISVTRRFPAARLNLGGTFNKMDRPGDAARVLSELVADYPEDSTARVMLADSLLRIQQWDEAGEQLQRALSDPKIKKDTRAAGHHQLAQIYYHEERYNAALRESEKALVADPNWPDRHQIYLLQGSVFYQLKNLEASEKALLKAYEIGGKRATGANLILGRIYTDQQKYDLALKAYEQYLNDFPNSPNTPMVRTAIERVKGMMKK